MTRYDSYKDSGVDWIGEIPSHWVVKRLKYTHAHISEKYDANEDDIRISPENVESGTGVCSNLYSDKMGEGMTFLPGDVLLNKLRLYLKKVLFMNTVGLSMGEMIVLRSFHGHPKFLFYSLFHQGWIDLLNSMSTGIKLPRVSPDDILNSSRPVPPTKEQEQIVEYLDEQTSIIDSTITTEEKRIELLKEYRQSLISEAVTGKRKI